MLQPRPQALWPCVAAFAARCKSKVVRSSRRRRRRWRKAYGVSDVPQACQLSPISFNAEPGSSRSALSGAGRFAGLRWECKDGVHYVGW